MRTDLLFDAPDQDRGVMAPALCISLRRPPTGFYTYARRAIGWSDEWRLPRDRADYEFSPRPDGEQPGATSSAYGWGFRV